MIERRPSFSWIYLVAAVLSFPLLGADGGCGGGDGPIGHDAGLADAVAPPSDVTTPPGDAVAGCRLSDGSICPVGTSCPAGDGCNTCSCTAGGRLACTERACPIDAGVMDASRDVCIPECAAPPPGCHYEGPISCTSCGRLVCDDAGPCIPECPAPPPGCHYEGPTSCSPPSCGRLVCADAGSEILCGTSFPTFDRSCRAASDCYVALHQTDCCGNSRAMGISATQQAAFERAEAICQPMFPRCGCPAHPPVTDDGMTTTFSSMIPVECRAGTCTTYVRPG